MVKGRPLSSGWQHKAIHYSYNELSTTPTVSYQLQLHRTIIYCYIQLLTMMGNLTNLQPNYTTTSPVMIEEEKTWLWKWTMMESENCIHYNEQLSLDYTPRQTLPQP